MKHRRTPILLAILLTACSSGPGVSQEELDRAVEVALVTEQPCIGDKTWHFPATVATSDQFSAEGVRALDALVEAGLLTSEDTTTTASRFTLGPDGGSRDVEVPAKAYALTDSGRAAYKEYDAPGFGSVGAFCYGRWEAEIVAFTDPAESSDGNLTSVTYTRRLADVPPWATVPVLASRSTQQRARRAADPAAQERMWLVRKDSGWVRTGG
jgi:hypothetical protein